MSSPLESFFLDRNYRRAINALSGITSTLYVSLNLLALHREKVKVTVETAFLLCLLLAVGMLLHSTIRKTTPKRSLPNPEPGKFLPVFISLAIGIALLGILQTKLVVRLQAAVIDARIVGFDKAIAHTYSFETPEQAQAQLRSRFQKLESIADVSYRYQIPISPSSSSTARQKVRAALNQPQLSESTKQTGWMAYAKLYDLAAMQATEGNTAPIHASGFVINSTVDLANRKIRFVGDHSALIFENGDIVIRNSTVVFDGISLRAQQPFREGLYLLGSGSSVVVRNATVENLDQTLDGITWINVEFRHSMIKVKNGSFTLVNVTFRDCDLRWLLPSGPLGGQVGLELRERISKANGQPITFAYDGIPLPSIPNSE